VVPTDALTSPPLHLRRRLAFLALGVGTWLAFRLLLAFPHVAEVLVGSGPIPLLAQGLSRASSWVPFPLAELVILGVVLRQATGAVGGIRQVRTGLDTWRRTLTRGGLRLGQDLGVVVFLFYLLWGFQYARPGLEHQLGLEPEGQLSVQELEPLARSAVEAANRAYIELHGVPDAGVPTPRVPADRLVPALEEGWRLVPARFDLHPRLERPHGAPKTWTATSLVKRTATSGMYFPYTGEALVVGGLPTVRLGMTLAHEMAHQRGVAVEGDANVLGFLVAREAPDPRVRYSAYVFLQGQMISALASLCAPCALEMLEGRLPGIERDLADLDRFWASSRGPISRAAGRMNDAMLRSHGIAEGTASYGGSRWILAALALRDGPEILFGEAKGPAGK
jgi:hypothetical protein